ncbi:MAG TPA: TetR family transcriptional regulator [Planctomycetes bacterium]|nr:TetR family transcriptional regulator [Planctomycetota bacterium]|tara:strand:- start:136 stop:870 length:735 start_codon:yes stop_codon:yes gene_type:complete
MAPTRKQREIAARHQRILAAAREQLLEGGYLGLSMDKLAAAVEYSKGTIYQHFSCKEEVVATLALETARVRLGLFECAATFRGRPRERMLAVGIAADLFLEHFPDHFRVEQIARGAVREKVSPERQRELASCEQRCMQICAGIVRDGVASGDLDLPAEVSPEELSFSLWSSSFGVFTIVTSGAFHLEDMGIAEPLLALRKGQNRMLDGFGWRPLTDEHDYEASAARIRAEVLDEVLVTLREETL